MSHTDIGLVQRYGMARVPTERRIPNESGLIRSPQHPCHCYQMSRRLRGQIADRIDSNLLRPAGAGAIGAGISHRVGEAVCPERFVSV